ncbi:rhodanese-related sulfurtransferase [Bdellovibrio sp. HCB209]|uniref:oxygen-dependent tRNA uridine(34) hydroxylase TrhO n=1 Tax=Bdellovibrio sp. HCB209 TaxID=3394354 RepID=UPI0039B68F42
MENAPKHYVTTFYKFLKIENPEAVKLELEAKADELNVKGLIILGTEGLNSTVAAITEQEFNLFKQFIRERFDSPNQFFKDSYSDKAPFRRFKVKIRSEIVTTGIPEMQPPEGVNHHLTPSEWNKVLKEETDWVMIDTRNWYEYKIGTFKGALNPNIEKFTDFPQYIEAQGIAKDKKMLIFCTGGIRCEKGILELQDQGYNNVFQLEGGIINYLAEYPNDQYEGECFVFDHRVALDQDLKPSQKYGLCPHCGQPSEVKIDCLRCDEPGMVCLACAELEFKKDTCSRNCAHGLKLHPGKKARKQVVPFNIEKMKAEGAADIPTIRVSKTKVVQLNDKGEATTVSTKN